MICGRLSISGAPLMYDSTCRYTAGTTVVPAALGVAPWASTWLKLLCVGVLSHGAALFRCFRGFYPVERPTTNHFGGCSQMLVDGHQRPLGDIWCFFLPCRAFFVTSWWVYGSIAAMGEKHCL